MQFSEVTRDRARQIIARYPVGRSRSALLPMLHLVQSEQGYVSPDGMAFCAELLGITKAQVAAVATFYTMYKRRPTGDWLVSVCTNTMCGVLGGDAAYQRLSELLGVGHDETTEDGSITLEHAECLAACDYAPVMTVNYEFFDQVDAESAVDVVETLRRGKRPVPTRGAGLCTFKEMSLQLAGFFDEREGALGEGPAGEPTLAGNRLAERHGVAVAGFDPDTPIGGDERKAPASPVVKPGAERVVTEKDRPAKDTPPAAKSAAETRRRARTRKTDGEESR